VSETREPFDGILGGTGYDVIAGLTGYGRGFYRAAARAIPIRPGMRLLDLGCGTGSLARALADRLGEDGRVVGIDLAPKQLQRARDKLARTPISAGLLRATARELPFGANAFDGIVSSLVFHALPDDVRARAIDEAHRVLRPGGFFALVDWSRPRWGYTAAVWGLTLLPEIGGPNWRGTYPEIFGGHGFELETDVYLDSLNRCQIFRAQH
jgi:ubiquinone/menaquinone biosynthesis C-methylase UbiE